MSGVSLDDAEPYGYALLTAAALLSPGIPVLLATRESVATETQQSTSAAGLVGRVPYGLIIFLTLVQMLQGAGEGVACTFFNVYLDTGL